MTYCTIETACNCWAENADRLYCIGDEYGKHAVVCDDCLRDMIWSLYGYEVDEDRFADLMGWETVSAYDEWAFDLMEDVDLRWTHEPPTVWTDVILY